jgi:HlyD family secretion protein
MGIVDVVDGRARRIAIAIAILMIVGGGLVYGMGKPTVAPAGISEKSQRTIVARGRIEPRDRVRTLQGPAGSIVAILNVREGDKVTAGTVLAEIDTRASLQAALAVEENRLAEVEQQLAQAAAPAKRSDIEAQNATVRRLRVEFQRLQRDFERSRSLAARDVVAAETLDARRTAMDQAQHALEHAEWVQRSLLEPREIDVKVAAARVATQRDLVEKVRADLERTVIRAPVDGTILTLLVREGEALGTEGLLQMGNLDNLIVVAEVDEFDISRVATGRRTTISGPSLAGSISGRVSLVSRAVFKQKRPTSDVLIGRDARIIEVEVVPETPLPPVVWGEVTVVISDVD